MYKNLTIATSIAPFNLSVQKQAISSWLNCGFRVVSINSIEEIKILQTEFSNVEFVETKSNAANKYGKPYIYFDNFLDYFSSADSKICGIVNSDIHFINFSDQLFQFIIGQSNQSIVYGSRIDIDSIVNLHGDVYELGLDFFFFDKDIIPLYPKNEFCIGLPWWDYWAVLAPILKGITAKRLITPFAYHIKHSINWNKDYWYSLGITLSQFINTHTIKNDEDLGEFGYSVLDFIEKSSSYINLSDRVKTKRILFVYDNKGIQSSESKTYESIVNQTYPNKSIVFGNNQDNFHDQVEYDYISYIQEGSILHPNYAEIMLSFNNDPDIIFCNFKVNKTRTSIFYLSSSVSEEGEVSRHYNSNMVYKRGVFLRDGIIRGEKKGSKACFVGHSLVHTNYTSYIENLLQGKKNIFIYGCGGHTKQLIELVDFSSFDLKGIIDSNPSGNYFEGYPVYAANEINNLVVGCILISSFSFESEIYEQLIKVINKGKIIRIYNNT
ncbi:hypothetical protein [Paenibacillus whitsoniae]|uniref:Uncharacterized protein n=1 Tax=Paenibacillus whitsoniae TaxID=2496558 RepID=A0A3S0CSS8_9BACL|nr:hypothetical protein [Paenibacillus whitsoniae]RTE07920.1 hypothetical protein EJQ19_19935 [Paenibacillus whitsoniae]